MLDIIKRSPPKWYWLGMGFLLFLAACSSDNGQVSLEPTEISQTPIPEPTQTEAAEREPADKYADYTIVTLLPRDAIPAIDNPQFLSTAEADEFYDPDELVIGVAFEGEARAYSVPFLSNHEIVNDTVAGRKIAVTW